MFRGVVKKTFCSVFPVIMTERVNRWYAGTINDNVNGWTRTTKRDISLLFRADFRRKCDSHYYIVTGLSNFFFTFNIARSPMPIYILCEINNNSCARGRRRGGFGKSSRLYYIYIYSCFSIRAANFRLAAPTASRHDAPPPPLKHTHSNSRTTSWRAPCVENMSNNITVVRNVLVLFRGETNKKTTS